MDFAIFFFCTVNAAYKLNGVSNLIRLSEIRYAVDGDETRCARTDDTARDPYITIYLQGINYVSELEIVFESYGKGQHTWYRLISRAHVL